MTADTCRPVANAEMYEACVDDLHTSCPAGRANAIPREGRCDCSCHHPLPPV